MPRFLFISNKIIFFLIRKFMFLVSRFGGLRNLSYLCGVDVYHTTRKSMKKKKSKKN